LIEIDSRYQEYNTNCQELLERIGRNYEEIIFIRNYEQARQNLLQQIRLQSQSVVVPKGCELVVIFSAYSIRELTISSIVGVEVVVHVVIVVNIAPSWSLIPSLFLCASDTSAGVCLLAFSDGHSD
jgi:hypothetical protein